jgi:phosphoenolpyruvate carboxylase
VEVADVSVDKMLKEFLKDVVKPETGTYVYKTVNDKGTTEEEKVEYEYQSLIEVFQYLTAQLLTESSIDVTSVYRVCVLVGGDHRHLLINYAGSDLSEQ